VAIEQPARAIDPAPEAAEARADAVAVAAPGEERELITDQAAGERGRDHSGQGEMALVRGETGHDEDGFPFEASADQHDGIAVPFDELAECHFYLCYTFAMLVDEIKQRLKAAMKAQNVVEREILRVALGEIQTIEARTGSMSDGEAAAIVKKLVKSNQETHAASENAEQRATLEQENAVLEALLPKTLNVDAIIGELTAALVQIKAAANDGQATGVAMKHLKATGAAVTGKDVAEAVKRIRG